MNKSYAMLVAATLALGACGDSGQSVEDSEGQIENDELGSLVLNLTAPDSSGREYRLRNAQFSIYGYPEYPLPPGEQPYSNVVSTEDDPDAPVISLRVVPGYYNVSLDSADWYLERRVDDEWERVEQAVLLSAAYTSVYVSHGWTSLVSYRFGVDGELIDFRAGELQIGIEIEQPGDFPADAGFPPGVIGGLFGGPGGGFVGGTIGGGIVGGTGGVGGIGADAGLPL